eukprot:579956_1
MYDNIACYQMECIIKIGPPFGEIKYDDDDRHLARVVGPFLVKLLLLCIIRMNCKYRMSAMIVHRLWHQVNMMKVLNQMVHWQMVVPYYQSSDGNRTFHCYVQTSGAGSTITCRLYVTA